MTKLRDHHDASLSLWFTITISQSLGNGMFENVNDSRNIYIFVIGRFFVLIVFRCMNMLQKWQGVKGLVYCNAFDGGI